MGTKNTFLWQVLTLGIKLGFTVAIPLLILLLVGRYLDKHFQTSPIFLLSGLLISLIFSFYGLYKLLNPLLKDLSKEKNKTTKTTK